MASFPFWLLFGAACGLGGVAYLVFEQLPRRRDIALLVFVVAVFVLMAVNYLMSHPAVR